MNSKILQSTQQTSPKKQYFKKKKNDIFPKKQIKISNNLLQNFTYIYQQMEQHSNFSRQNGTSFTKIYPMPTLIHCCPIQTDTQYRLSYNIPLANTNQEQNNPKDEQKPLKNNNFPTPHTPITNHHSPPTKPQPIPPNPKSITTPSPTTNQTTPKTVPSFLQNRNQMKNSYLMNDTETLTKNHKNQISHNNTENYHCNKRIPRMSQLPDMKYSGMEFITENKIPSFLQEKSQRKQKKVPYTTDTQRPQSSKQSTPKSQHPQSQSLSNSYGSMKKSKFGLDTTQSSQLLLDPTQDWVKKSWNKKKQKKFSINDFQQIKDLGSGKYGHVYLTKQKKTNFICALKIIQKKLLKEQQITQQFIRQLKVQSFLNHSNIIKMYGFFDDHINIYIILELGTDGQLYKQLKKHQSMPQAKVASIMRQICNAVSQLHWHHIIHRDIKPQNIVLSQNIIKLCDFGWSVYAGQTLRNTFCGTPLYVGPQILKGKDYNQKIDIWSLGVMMYQMLVGENPFKITKEEQLIKIIKDDIKIPAYVELSHDATNFLLSCLQKNPEDRPNIRELLNHEFFKKNPEKIERKVTL